MTLRLELRPGALLLWGALLLLDTQLTGLLFLSAAAHELGHLLALCTGGVPAADVVLTAGGAVLDCPPLTRRGLIRAAAAGPVVNLALAVGLLRLAPAAALLNLGMAVFNLLPVPPLDGGVLLAQIAPRAVRPAQLAVLAAALAAAAVLRRSLGLWPLALVVWMALRAWAESDPRRCSGRRTAQSAGRTVSVG